MPISGGPRPHYDHLLAKIESVGPLTEAQRAAIRGLPIRERTLERDEDIILEGEASTEVCLVLEGFVCRYKLLDDGRRQIFSFHLPGDIPDMQSLHLGRMDHCLAALLKSRVAFVPHHAVRQLSRDHPALADLFWRDTLVDAAIFREWMVGLGRRTAYARIAHLFCELMVRFRAVGLAREDTIALRLTQIELADALGLSSVHVNRVLHQLKADDLINVRPGVLQVLDWRGLMTAGEFDDAYLHLAPAA